MATTTIQQRVAEQQAKAAATRTAQERRYAGVSNPAAKTQVQKLTFAAPGVTKQECAPGWHWDSSLLRCVKDTSPIKETVTERVTGSPVVSGTNMSMGTRATGTNGNPQTANTFENILKGVGSQKVSGTDEYGRSTENYRFSEYEYGGKRYGFNEKTGQLEVIGDAAENNNTVVGVESSGRRFNLGETRENSGGLKILSREDKLAQAQDLRDSAENASRTIGGSYVNEKGETVNTGKPLPGTGLTGQEKLEKYKAAGLHPEMTPVGTYAQKRATAFNASAAAVPSLQNLVNVDFVAQSGMFDNAPAQGENEDPKDYQIRVSNWKLGQITGKFNQEKSKSETSALAKAVQDVPKILRGELLNKTTGEISASFKNDPEFQGKYESLKQNYKEQRLAKAQADIEKKKATLSGSTETAKRILAAITDTIMKEAQADIDNFNTEIETQKATDVDTYTKTIKTAQDKIKNLSSDERSELLKKNDRKKREQEYIDKGYSPLEAEKLVNKDLAKLDDDPKKIAAYDQFKESVKEGKLKPDGSNAVELMIDSSDGDMEKAKAIHKAWGGITEKEYITQLGEYKKMKFGMTDEEIQEDVKRDSVWEIAKASANGGKLTMEEMDKLEKYEFENPLAAARMKLKIANPDMADSEIYLQVQKAFSQPKAAKATGTKSTPGAKGTVQSAAMLDMMNDVYGELSAGNIGMNKTEADQYLRSMYPKSTSAQRSAAIAQVLSYDPSIREYSLVDEAGMNVKAVSQQYAGAGTEERKSAIENAKKWMSEGEFVDGVWYPKGEMINQPETTTSGLTPEEEALFQ